MLRHLTVRNFAVIEAISVEFKDGLNLLTGETGSGKSIIVDALGLLLGERGSQSLIRTGEKSAFVEGIFELGGDEAILAREVLEGAGVYDESHDEIVIRREVMSTGKTRVFINDRSVGVSILRSLKPLLVEIHGQGDQKLLRSGRAQLDLLDSYAGCQSLRREVGEAYSHQRGLLSALETIANDSRERERNLELVQHQLSEIDAIAPIEGEDTELAQIRLVMANAERILESCGRAFNELYESDRSVLSSLAGITRRIREVSELDPRLESVLGSLEEGSILVSESADALRNYVEGIDFSPDEFSRIDNRLSEIERIKRKLGTDLPGVIGTRARLAQELEKLSGLSDEKRSLESQLVEAREAYARKANELSRLRRAAAVKLEREIAKQLPSVALEHANLKIELETRLPADDNNLSLESADDGVEDLQDSNAGDGYFSAYGADRIIIHFSANPGEALHPLSQVASGGELSRLMLTLLTSSRKNLRQSSGSATTIFDEIDSGIGGRVAEAVGRRLKSLARTSQVLCVTHQPQIARFADAHFLVEKRVVAGRTMTSVDVLYDDARVREVARMIVGDEEEKTTIETARWMLQNAG